MDDSKVPGIFAILVGGALLEFGLVCLFPDLVAELLARITGYATVGLACLYWQDKFPKRKA